MAREPISMKNNRQYSRYLECVFPSIPTLLNHLYHLIHYLS